MTKGFWERRFWWIVAMLLATKAGMSIPASLADSQTWDEGIYLSSGYRALTTGDYRINPDTPPLAKLLYGLSLFPLRPDWPPADVVPNAKSARYEEIGRAFLYHNRVRAETMLGVARGVAIAVSLALGVAIAAWARRRFGAPAALFALLLFTFDPNLLAHGRYATTEPVLTVFLFLACVAWAGYLDSGRWQAVVGAGICAGLACASKPSGVLVAPILFLMAAWSTLSAPRRAVTRFLPALGMVFAIALLAANATYLPQIVSLARRGELIKRVSPKTRLLGGSLYPLTKALPVVEMPYLRGFDSFLERYRRGEEAYLFGSHSKSGWWFYYPVAFLLKSPLAILLLVAVCGWVLWRARSKLDPLSPSPEWLACSIAPTVVFLATMANKLDLGVRYIVPAYPFFYILLAAILFRYGREVLRNRFRAVIALTGALLVIESAAVYPHHLAFFNALVGGPSRGHLYLLDSNLDWGQDLGRLARYLNGRGVTSPCLEYFGTAEPGHYGLRPRPLPTTQEVAASGVPDCVAAISATELYEVHAPEGSFRWLREREPDARVGYSIFVYDLRRGG